MKLKCKECGYECDGNEEDNFEDMSEHLFFEHQKNVFDTFVYEVKEEKN